VKFALGRPVRVFAVDIDGCLAAVGHAAYDLAAMHAIAELNRASTDDATVPALTFVTGRPHGYVDALMQALDVRLPVSFENGAGLATRHPYRAHVAPAVRSALSRVRALEDLVRGHPEMLLQPGKLASLSVFPQVATRELGPLVATLEGLIAEHGLDLEIDPSNDCVNVLVPGVTKEQGFEWLCATLEVEPDEVAGIGDSVGDVGWLRRCAVSMAPANAAAEVRAAVALESTASDVQATLECYRALVAANRARLGVTP
jgi:hydroxymethylpyrimidine pyrophosphatase-like HAD family hydrolase